MQVVVGIPLIILGFLIPILIYVLYRRYLKKKAQDQITEGEIFDKDGERFGIVEDGHEHDIPKRKTITLQ